MRKITLCIQTDRNTASATRCRWWFLSITRSFETKPKKMLILVGKYVSWLTEHLRIFVITYGSETIKWQCQPKLIKATMNIIYGWHLMSLILTSDIINSDTHTHMDTHTHTRTHTHTHTRTHAHTHTRTHIKLHISTLFVLAFNTAMCHARTHTR